MSKYQKIGIVSAIVIAAITIVIGLSIFNFLKPIDSEWEQYTATVITEPVLRAGDRSYRRQDIYNVATIQWKSGPESVSRVEFNVGPYTKKDDQINIWIHDGKIYGERIEASTFDAALMSIAFSLIPLMAMGGIAVVQIEKLRDRDYAKDRRLARENDLKMRTDRIQRLRDK